jgi:hypothetical protein
MRAVRFSFRRWLALAALAAAVFAPCRYGDAADGWADQRVAGPFVCRADFPLDGLQTVLDELAQLQEDLVQLLDVPAADEWIEIYLFHDQATYRTYLKRHFPELPYRRALYVKRSGPGIVMAYFSGELAVDLRHECTHALLHAVLPMVPLWLDEGLAEYFEVAPSGRAFGNEYLSGVRWKARLGMAPRLDKLEEKGSVEQMGSAEYRDAWAWVHFMLHGPAEANDELQRFLADIRAHTPPGLLSQRLERRLPGVRQLLAAHFRSGSR